MILPHTGRQNNVCRCAQLQVWSLAQLVQRHDMYVWSVPQRPCFSDWNNISEICPTTLNIYVFHSFNQKSSPLARLNNFFLPSLRSFRAAMRRWLTTMQLHIFSSLPALPQIDVEHLTLMYWHNINIIYARLWKKEDPHLDVCGFLLLIRFPRRELYVVLCEAQLTYP